jgi:hypothetical protein
MTGIPSHASPTGGGAWARSGGKSGRWSVRIDQPQVARLASGERQVTSDSDGPIDPVGLVHPAYLDAEMLVTFLAALEDGVAYIRRTQRRSEASKRTSGEAKLQIPGISQALGLGLSGRLARDTGRRDTEEESLDRSHTAASLFVKLRTQLLFDKSAVRSVQSADDLLELQPGDLVEVTGDLAADPLAHVLDTMADAATFIESVIGIDLVRQMGDHAINQRLPAEATAFLQAVDADRLSQPRPQPQRARGNPPPPQPPARSPTVQWSEVVKQVGAFVHRVRDEVRQAPVVDFLMTVPSSDVKVVLALSRQQLTDAGAEQMNGGYFTALGKVTRVLGDGDSVNLLRRTVFSTLPEDTVTRVYEAVKGSPWQLSMPELLILPPGLQVLPLAIYV